MKTRVLVNVLFVTVFVMSLTLVGPRQFVSANPDPIIFLDPNPAHVSPGGRIVTSVKIKDVTSMDEIYGIEFFIEFDPALVQVLDSDPDAVGVQVEFPEGTYFEGRDYFIGRNYVDNEEGRIEFAASFYKPAFPLTVDAVLVRIEWEAVVSGWSSIDFVHSKLTDKDGVSIQHTVSNGAVGSDTRPEIVGRVILQGRPENWLEGTLVVLTTEPCVPCFATQSVQSAQVAPQGVNIIPDMPYTYTDDKGYFSIIPFDNHDYRCLQVFNHGYLTGQKALPREGFAAPTNLGTIKLLGGDVNEDDIINIFDLVKIASHMNPGPYDKVADINLDRKVDIADLSITAGNFGLRGPVCTWNE